MTPVLSVIVARYDVTDEIRRQSEANIQRVKEQSRLPIEVIEVDNTTGKNCIAAAWNTGWKRARGEFLCWLNSDCAVTARWDEPLCQVADSFPVIAMPYTDGQKSDGVGITGWCFVARTDTAERIGPFDEQFTPAYYEDTDWFQRAIDLGIPLANVPASNVLHVRGRGGTVGLGTARDRIFVANRDRYYTKHRLNPNLPPPFWSVPLIDIEVSTNG